MNVLYLCILVSKTEPVGMTGRVRIMDLDSIACVFLLSFWMYLLASGAWTLRALKNAQEEQ